MAVMKGLNNVILLASMGVVSDQLSLNVMKELKRYHLGVCIEEQGDVTPVQLMRAGIG